MFTLIVNCIYLYLYSKSPSGMKRLLQLFNQYFYIVNYFMVPNEFFVKSASIQRHSNFVLSMTTSPSRLKNVHKVFATFSQYRKIILNLPLKFRNTESYCPRDIEQLQSSVPRLHINWIPEDLGPHSKLLGTLACNLLRREDIIVVIDDDTYYTNELLDVYAGALQKSQQMKTDADVVIVPTLVTRYGLRTPEGCQSFCFRVDSLMKAFGVAQVAEVYSKFKQVSDKYTQAHEKCKYHDDIVFGAVFHELNFQIVEQKFTAIFQMIEGFDDDALHNIADNNEKHFLCARAIWTTKEQCPTDERISLFLNR